MERTCPHGVGHPDPDSPWAHDSHEWIHGCDGCCLDEDIFALTSATDRRKRSPVGTVYNDPEKIFPVTEDVVKRLRSITTAKLANAAADEIVTRLEREIELIDTCICNWMLEDAVDEIKRLRKLGDAMAYRYQHFGPSTEMQDAVAAWEEARRG